jgi:hypothetical protein
MSDAAEASTTVKSPEEIEKSPEGVVRRWLAELDLAGSTESDWRGLASTVWDLYKSKNVRAKSFNILWSNTETMRPALYNSMPRPDVRRRFRDPDPVGKVASNVLERALTYAIDAYDFDEEIKLSILDMLLSGRGVVRVKYEPELHGDDLLNESTLCAHVNWRDYRRGPGKKRSEVPWEAFRHDLTRDECIKKFGEDKANGLDYTDRGKFEDESKHNDDVKALLQTVEVWEIWDKIARRVLFINSGYKAPLLEVDDPLKLQGFFCTPRPIYAIEDSESLVPQIPYEKYREQAEELNDITYRIAKIVRALKVRGAYSSQLSEIAKIIGADDNEMIAVENASLVKEAGGLEKQIWIMPIEKLIQVLEGLMKARAECIQTIYEITGLGDIMRGVSNPHETLGAQQLKSQWGSLRLQRLQREVQRFIRDILRLKAEIMAEHFSPETLQTMTSVILPTPEQKAQAQQILQAAQAAQQQPPSSPAGQQPGAAPPAGAMPPQPPAPPPVPPEAIEAAQSALKLPTWEDVMGVITSDKLRAYRIGIETDSTVAETLSKDAEGLTAAVTGVVQLFQGIGPAVQMGILSVEVVKQLALAVTRRMQMGDVVEDAIEQIKQPPPMPPEGKEADNSVEVAKVKAEADLQKAAAAEESKKQIAQFTEQNKAQTAAAAEQTKLQMKQMEIQSNERIAAMEAQLKQMEVQMQEMTKQRNAQMQTQAQQETALAKQNSDERMRSAEIESNESVAREQGERDMQTRENEARLSAEASVINAETAASASRDNAKTSAEAKSQQQKLNKPKAK